MVRRADPVAVIWAVAPPALRFLADDFGFTGPEHTADGVGYHRPGLHVDMGLWAWKNERGFTTALTRVRQDGTLQRRSLGMLYIACGLGPASAAPEGAGTLYVIRKRIGQHAAALRVLVTRLDEGDADALFAASRDHTSSTAPSSSAAHSTDIRGVSFGWNKPGPERRRAQTRLTSGTRPALS
jgi:hypothetical protein